MGQKRIIDLDEKLAIESGDVLIMDNESSGSSKITAVNLMKSKQDKEDSALETTSKTIVGAINEVVDNTYTKTELDTTLATKQNKTDNSLHTTSKTVVGAINEVKSAADDTYTTTEVDTALALKQDSSDNSLETDSKQIVGAINELKGGVDNAYTITEAHAALQTKQNITDNTLQTTNKTIVGAINELIGVFANYYTQTQTDTALASKQDKQDGNLNTDSKQIVGAINELLSALADFYTKAQVDDMIAAVSTLNIEIVEQLPTTDIDTHTIYFVLKDPNVPDVYEEYMYINDAWVLIGVTSVDPTMFYTKSEIDTMLAGKQNTLTFDTTPTASSSNPVTSDGIKTALDDKAPNSHASTASTYGLGSTGNYGHVKVINELTKTEYVDGEALAAYQGAILSGMIAQKQNTLVFDTTPTAGSSNPVTSGGIKIALDDKAPNSHASTASTYGLGSTGNYGHVKVINELTKTAYADGEALAAYQGKVLADRIANKQDTLTFDTTPTANSTNPVTSGGIKTALDGKAPTSHASSATTYGVGTTANYGHVKVINGLTQSAYANGEALAAYQGKVLNDKIAAITPAALGFGKGTCGTAAATAAKVVTLSGYNLITNGIIAVKFTYAVPASATLNVNSKGAKSIYYRGSAITAGVIDAGDIAVFIYNGSQYDLLTTDKLMSMHF